MKITRRQFGMGAAAVVGGAASQDLWAVASAPGLGVVETEYGRVSGGYADGVSHFLGIPYGADTGGANRFLPPRPAPAWTGIREATRFGSSAPQTNRDAQPIDSPLMGLFPRDPEYIQESEDCLRLNVWTPASRPQGRRPVLVWLHGGGFSLGSGSWPIYDGANFAWTNDVVVVSVNHRLNMFGYSYLADVLGDDYRTSANAGMLDIVAALQWVADNITSFGGDPNNVTIRGQSGGGGKVSTLLAMPSAHGLFHKAIIESGPRLRGQEASASVEPIALLIEALGAKDKLRSASTQDLLRAYFSVQSKLGRFRGFSPAVDGIALPRHPYDPDATPLSAQVPLLIGRTHHESATFTLGRKIADEGALLESARSVAPQDKAEEIVAAYRAAYPQAHLQELAVLISTDSGTGARTRLLADRKSVQPVPVYTYRFDWETKVLDGALRATHGMDTSFIFNNTDIDPLVGDDPSARPLAEKVCRSWGAFVRNGSPETNDGLGAWPRYNALDRQTMIINNASKVVSDPNGKLMDMFETRFR